MSQTNVSIWEQVSKTDPDYTKEYSGAGGFSGTSVNGHYMVMRATEVFGPIGIGWGYTVEEERVDTGGVIQVLENGEEIRSQSHIIKLKLWYKHGEERGEVEHFGITPYVFKTRNGIMTDPEAPKKSLTDAIKKCLSMLGFAADIYLGQYDDVAYVEQVAGEFKIEKAESKAEERDKQQRIYKEKMEKYLKQIGEAVTMPELEALFKESIRKAKYRDDKDMLRKLTEAKDHAKNRLETMS